MNKNDKDYKVYADYIMSLLSREVNGDEFNALTRLTEFFMGHKELRDAMLNFIGKEQMQEIEKKKAELQKLADSRQMNIYDFVE